MSKRKVDAVPVEPPTEQLAAKKAASAVWEEVESAPKPMRCYWAKGSSTSKKTQKLLAETRLAPDAVDAAIQSSFLEELKSLETVNHLFPEGTGAYKLGKLLAKGPTYVFTAEDRLASIICFENSKLQFVLVRRAAACGVKGRVFLQTAIGHWRKENPKSKTLNVITHEDNIAALKCYAACGFDGEGKEGHMRRLRLSFE